MKNETFETSLVKLENLIRELESGEIDLDDSIAKYKEATKLLKFCDDKLKSATKTVNQVLNKDGDFEQFKLEE